MGRRAQPFQRLAAVGYGELDGAATAGRGGRGKLGQPGAGRAGARTQHRQRRMVAVRAQHFEAGIRKVGAPIGVNDTARRRQGVADRAPGPAQAVGAPVAGLPDAGEAKADGDNGNEADGDNHERHGRHRHGDQRDQQHRADRRAGAEQHPQRRLAPVRARRRRVLRRQPPQRSVNHDLLGLAFGYLVPAGTRLPPAPPPMPMTKAITSATAL